MSILDSDAPKRAKSYLKLHDIEQVDRLGYGADGIVLSTSRQSAIKVFQYRELYENERNVYRRLQEHKISKIDDFNVPQMLYSHDQLMVIEMQVVVRPFVVDFAGAYLDKRPPFDDEQLREWEEDRKEVFGNDWVKVRGLMATLRGIGIYLGDVKPGNVTC